ncbi:helix-turn-helix domain-containing protein [Pannonibacter phragmitetus]|uniref:helix-turn-helix domain-containing protein n=1 Tax=Pannonibacter phragmitetus TaxID=121719 RepID=UPI001AD91D94|nr:helix-turn-helix domain-containing protein [Pannonibacter phragmitetus]
MAYLERNLTRSPMAGTIASRVPVPEVTSHFASFGAKSVSYKPHDVIYYQGDPADRIFEVGRGTVMLFKLLPDGRRQVVEVLRAGDIFGMPAGEEQDCTAETLTDACVHTLDLHQIEVSPDIQRQLTKCLIAQMQHLHEHAVLLGRKSATERVASFLMHLVPDRGGNNCMGPVEDGLPDSRQVKLHMTRQEIADYLGLTIETVSRVISDMKRRGLITLERNDEIRLNRVCAVCQLTGKH